MFSLINQVCLSFVNLVYPPTCMHCRCGLDAQSRLLCAVCLAQMDLIDPATRCPFCFSDEYSPERPACVVCMAAAHKQTQLMHRVAAAFDYMGPPATLVKSLKYSDKPYLANGLAAYLVAQFCHLDWPLPDVVVPVPLAFTHWLDRGYNQSALLAQGMAEMLHVPYLDALKRSSGDYSQAGLNHRQRQQLSAKRFTLKNPAQLHDKCILLIDDVLTSGSTLQCCAQALMEECPGAIYGLTLCRAI